MIDTSLVAGVSAAVISFVVGYTIGKLPSGGVPPPASKKDSQQQSAPDEEIEKVFDGIGGEYKMVLVVRNDLKMGKGKIAAQCGHAAVGAYETAVRKTPTALKKWQHSGQAKIAVKVETEADMMEIYRTARANNLNCCVIRDAGRTQIEPNTKTVLAIGPAPKLALDSLTGHLKLL